MRRVPQQGLASFLSSRPVSLLHLRRTPALFPNLGGAVMGRLDGKNALVTGASRGIGRAIALQLIRDGAKVALNYRSGEAECHSLAEEIRGLGGEVLLLRADVSSAKEARELIGQVLEKWGRLHILVNNAG